MTGSPGMTAAGCAILHVSADYPDPLMAQKTRAISNLLELVPECSHHVYSLNRVGWRAGISALDFADNAGREHRAVAYGAPPKGLFLRHYLDRLADWIAEDVIRRGLRPVLVHAHKLSVEGFVGASLARRLDIPLAISVQGHTDLKIVGARPDLVPRWRQVWHGASALFSSTGWATAWLNDRLGTPERRVALLPCPIRADEMMLPRISGPVFRSGFHLAVHRRKNADGLMRAVAMAARSVPEIRLEIVGGGDAAAFARLSAHAGRLAPGRVRFLGVVPNADVQGVFNSSCAFALVSHRESFGMVFTEALLAGAPCLIPKNWGIDGYLEDGGVVLSAPSRDTAAIAEGLVRLAREEEVFKSRLARLAETGGLDLFRRAAIAGTYRAGLAEALLPAWRA